MRGRKKFPPFKRGEQKVLPCLEGGAQKVSDLAIFSFCSPPPLPVINDQSLIEPAAGTANTKATDFLLLRMYPYSKKENVRHTTIRSTRCENMIVFKTESITAYLHFELHIISATRIRVIRNCFNPRPNLKLRLLQEFFLLKYDYDM